MAPHIGLVKFGQLLKSSITKTQWLSGGLNWKRKCGISSGSGPSPLLNKARVTVTFITKDDEKLTVQGNEGDNLLDIAVNNELDLDGYGSCGGTLSCSTCHVILKEEDYNKLPNTPHEEETDMLDLAYGLTKTSRLGCQVCVTKDLDGLIVHLPSQVRDARNE